MNNKFGTSKGAPDKLVEGIKHKTRKHSSTEEKIRIVQAGLCHHVSIGCGGGVRPDGGAQSLGSGPYRHPSPSNATITRATAIGPQIPRTSRGRFVLRSQNAPVGLQSLAARSGWIGAVYRPQVPLWKAKDLTTYPDLAT